MIILSIYSFKKDYHLSFSNVIKKEVITFFFPNKHQFLFGFILLNLISNKDRIFHMYIRIGYDLTNQI